MQEVIILEDTIPFLDEEEKVVEPPKIKEPPPPPPPPPPQQQQQQQQQPTKKRTREEFESEEPLHQQTKSVKTNTGESQKITKSTLVIYTDGSCKNNGKPGAIAGCGVWFGHEDKRNLSERVERKKITSQVAEVFAAKRALEILEHEGDMTTPIEIRSDSSYLINTMTVWFKKRILVHWNVDNGELFKEIHQLWRKRTGGVTWTHVRGHVGMLGNEMADKLAKKAIGVK